MMARRPILIKIPFNSRKMRSLPHARRKTFCSGYWANKRSSGTKIRQVS